MVKSEKLKNLKFKTLFLVGVCSKNESKTYFKELLTPVQKLNCFKNFVTDK